MQTLRAINNFMDYQKMNSGKKTVKNYSFFFKSFEAKFLANSSFILLT